MPNDQHGDGRSSGPRAPGSAGVAQTPSSPASDPASGKPPAIKVCSPEGAGHPRQDSRVGVRPTESVEANKHPSGDQLPPGGLPPQVVQTQGVSFFTKSCATEARLAEKHQRGRASKWWNRNKKKFSGSARVSPIASPNQAEDWFGESGGSRDQEQQKQRVSPRPGDGARGQAAGTNNANDSSNNVDNTVASNNVDSNDNGNANGNLANSRRHRSRPRRGGSAAAVSQLGSNPDSVSLLTAVQKSGFELHELRQNLGNFSRSIIGMIGDLASNCERQFRQTEALIRSSNCREKGRPDTPGPCSPNQEVFDESADADTDFESCINGHNATIPSDAELDIGEDYEFDEVDCPVRMDEHHSDPPSCETSSGSV